MPFWDLIQTQNKGGRYRSPCQGSPWQDRHGGKLFDYVLVGTAEAATKGGVANPEKSQGKVLPGPLVATGTGSKGKEGETWPVSEKVREKFLAEPELDWVTRAISYLEIGISLGKQMDGTVHLAVLSFHSTNSAHVVLFHRVNNFLIF